MFSEGKSRRYADEDFQRNDSMFQSSEFDKDSESIIIPNFSNDSGRYDVSNVIQYVEIPIQRRSSESQIQLEHEEEKYTEDVYGAAKQLIFADLSLANWSNKENSISSHSEFVVYDSNDKRDRRDDQEILDFSLNKETLIEGSPLLEFDSNNIFKPKIDENEFSDQLSQDSILYSPIDLK
jgi:hypothetical protein